MKKTSLPSGILKGKTAREMIRASDRVAGKIKTRQAGWAKKIGKV